MNDEEPPGYFILGGILVVAGITGAWFWFLDYTHGSLGWHGTFAYLVSAGILIIAIGKMNERYLDE